MDTIVMDACAGDELAIRVLHHLVDYNFSWAVPYKDTLKSILEQYNYAYPAKI